MIFSPPTYPRMLLLCLILTIFSSCSKDSDLLSDYVSENDQAALDARRQANNQATGSESTDSGTDTQEPDATNPPDIPEGDLGEIKAFPGAEGFAKYASGGRDGIVVEVTNLNDSGPGSLREALLMTMPRTIVFKVSGIIECSDYLSIPSNAGNVTIAGQTAPGGGILIKNGELRIQASNVIVRHLRIRVGSGVSGDNRDGIKIRSFRPEPLYNVIIDHCSVSWGQDENISITNAENVTIQNTIVSESQYGLLIQDSKNVSIINNLFALNHSRSILANTVDHFDLTFEMINNLVFGFQWATSGTDGMSFNVIENIYKSSRDFESITDYCVTLTAPNAANGDFATISTTHAYLSGNSYDSGVKGLYREELIPYLFDQPKYSSTYVADDVSKLESNLISNLGASVPERDAVDARIIQNYSSGTGKYTNVGTFPSIGSASGYVDLDQDGIDDTWESAYGIDNKNPDDGQADKDNDGYSNLETFLHYLATR